MRQTSIIIIIILCVLSSCKSPEKNDLFWNKKDPPINKRFAVVNDTLYAKYLSLDKSCFWEPSQQDYKNIEFVLEKAINDGSFNFLKKPSLRNVKKYYRQYACIINKSGDKIVFINALCRLWDEPDKIVNGKLIMQPVDWEKHLIIVNDGGKCFWQIKINLNKLTYSEFNVNGEA